MSSDSWPPLLKEWVAKCLGQMTESNRVEAQAELRQVISNAFTNQTLWTTPWADVQLQSLQPRPYLPQNQNILKRKIPLHVPPSPKKNKKAAKKVAIAALDPNDVSALNRRAQRFHREHEIERQRSLGLHQTRDQGFVSFGAGYTGESENPEADPNVPGWDKHTIIGTNKELFKDFLRLTSAVKIDTVRPHEVLRKSIEALKQDWKTRGDYNYMCSQLKSVRQDLVVQRIKNEFTVSVYELHARIALEKNDMVEYNQCQSMLRSLYDLHIPGQQDEFTAYHILMLLLGRNMSDLNLFVGRLTPEQKSNDAIVHALNVHRAISTGNYHSLFRLYTDCPGMGAYIMDHFVQRFRLKALAIMARAYRTLSIAFIQQELAFDTTTAVLDFLIENRAGTWTNPNSPESVRILDCKPAAPELARAMSEKFRKITITGAI